MILPVFLTTLALQIMWQLALLLNNCYLVKLKFLQHITYSYQYHR